MAIISWQKASLRYAFCAPICCSRSLWGKVNVQGAIIKSPNIPCTEENEPQSRRGGGFLNLTAKIFAFAKRFA